MRHSGGNPAKIKIPAQAKLERGTRLHEHGGGNPRKSKSSALPKNQRTGKDGAPKHPSVVTLRG